MPHPTSIDETLHQLVYLVGSIAILGLAPILHRLSRRFSRVTRSIDLLVGLVTLALVGLHVLPECVEIAGSPALLAAIAGAFLPALFEHRLRALATRATACLAAVALALHAVVDGLAIAGAHAGHGHGHSLELAVILHRLPFSAALWWFLRPRGRAIAVGALCLLGVATILGFGLGSAAAAVSGTSGALFQAFVGGMVLHVLLHRPVASTVDAVLPWALAGFFLLLGLGALMHQREHAIPVGLALLGMAFVFVMPRFQGRAQRRSARGSMTRMLLASSRLDSCVRHARWAQSEVGGGPVPR